MSTAVAFADMAAYHAWHDVRCLELGIPRPGYNGATGAPAVVAQWTTAYAAPLIIDGRVCVMLPAEQIAADPVLAALEVVAVHYPEPPDSDTDAAGNPASVIEPVPPEQYEKTLPATWTDPETGVTYDAKTGATA